MIDRLRARLDAGRQDNGFTLIELLIVIVILGILAAIVVFAVGGIQDKGQTSACDADKKTVQTAEEAYFANKDGGNGKYGTIAQLVAAKSLASASTLHDVTVAADQKSYSITNIGTTCN
jgi:general secretion pathway protein G